MNIDYAIIDAATGLVKRFGSCPDVQFQHQCGAGELIIAGAYPDDEWYWDGAQMQRLPPRPGRWHRFNRVAKAWEDGRTAQQLRAHHLHAIDAERTRRATASPIAHGGMQVEADADAAKRVWKKVDAVRLQVEHGGGPPADALSWQDAQGVKHQFPNVKAYRDFVEGFAIALEQRESQAFEWSKAKKAALAALGDETAALRAFDPLN